MRWCLRVKLAQHWQNFGNLLLSTGNKPIVEESRKDDFWGAKIRDDQTLVGRNALGRLLMELREELKLDANETLRFVEPLAIPDFLLMERLIEPVDFNSEKSSSVLFDKTIQEPAPSTEEQPTLFEQPVLFPRVPKRPPVHRGAK